MITIKEIIEKQHQDTALYKVAICVTSYNQKEYIEDALKGLLSQETTFPYLIVVGDDCSTDGSQEILLKYQKEYPEKIRLLLHEKNIGVNENRKQIILNCEAPYIAFCDGDDYWIANDCLQRKLDFLEKHPEYIGYQSACYRRRADCISEDMDLEETGCFFDFGRENAVRNNYPGQVGGFFFRNIYRYMNKTDFHIYMIAAVDDSGKLPIVAGIIAPIYRQDRKPTFIYRFHEESMERQKEKTNMCKKLFMSHLQYEKMVKTLFNNEVTMNIQEQLMKLVTDSFITAVKSGFAGKAAKENWQQFGFLYHYGYFSKKQIRNAIGQYLIMKVKKK